MLEIADHPTFVQRAHSPAETFVHSGVFHLGRTIPSYNGQSLFRPPRSILEPEISTRRLASPVDGFRYEGQVRSVPRHRLHWRVELPPDPASDGAWHARDVEGHRVHVLAGSVLAFQRSQGEAVAPELERRLDALHPGRRCTVVVRAAPDVERFLLHVRHHELQHVADHMWLARQILGRWDERLEELQQRGIRVLGRHGYDLEALRSLFSYSTTPFALLRYLWTAIHESGLQFHRTPEGAAPVPRLVDVSDGTVLIELSPLVMLDRAPELKRPRPHREFAVKGRGITGSEERVPYGSPERLALKLTPVREAFVAPQHH